MRRTDDLIDTAGGSDLPKSEEDEAVDRISDLPEVLLLHILSFLPFRCAVRASLMLRPFRGLWRYLSSLSLKDYKYRHDLHTCNPSPSESGGDRLGNFINHVLAQLESPEIHTFQIAVGSYAGISTDPYDVVGLNSGRHRFHRWISFALKKKVKVLDINLMMYRHPRGSRLTNRRAPSAHPGGSRLNYCRVPSAVFTASSLVELNLSAPNVEFGEQIQLKSLQKLWMCDVRLSEEVMRKLVLGSPSLKKVTLRNCNGLRVLKIDRHPSLEELNVRQCRDLEKVDLASSGIKILAVFILDPINNIICPNVSTLELDGPKLDGVNLETGSSLNDVALYLHHGGNFFPEEVEAKTLLEKLRNITSFSLTNRIMLVFSRWKLMNERRRSFNWKSVTMILHLAKQHLPGISYVLETCNFLETLTIYVFPSHKDIEDSTWDQACNFDGRSYWHSVEGTVEGTFHCLVHHLKNVMIYARVTEPYVIELIEFLLGNALVLETMVISTKRNFKSRNGSYYCTDVALEKHFTSDTLLDFSKKISSIPRISPNAVVHLT